MLNVELFSYKTYDAGLGNLGNERERTILSENFKIRES